MGYETDCRMAGEERYGRTREVYVDKIVEVEKVVGEVATLDKVVSLLEERIEELKKTQFRLEKRDKKQIEIGITIHRRCELEEIIKEIGKLYP